MSFVTHFATALRKVLKFLERRRLPHAKIHYDWAIGVYEGMSPLRLRPALGVLNPVLTAADVNDAAALFVADPFVVQQSDCWHMFFEVMNGTSGRGEIGWAISTDFCSWRYQSIILREPFHLSYPAVFKWQDNWYMIPESYWAQGLRLYCAEEFPLRWKLAATLLAGSFTDHSLVRHGNLWWLFVGTAGEKNPEGADTLELYFAEALRGPWHPHPRSPIRKDDPRLSRPAGRIISTEAGLLRVAQDCSGRYGKEVNGALIHTLTQTAYEEEILSRPVLTAGAQAWHSRGMHHLDAHEISSVRWLAAVDGYRRRFSFHWR